MQPAKVYVANEEGGSVSVIDLQDSLKNTSIDISDSSGKMFMAHNVQVAPDGKTVWVTVVPMDTNGINQLVVKYSGNSGTEDRATGELKKNFKIKNNAYV